MNIHILTILQSDQRYETCGDWWFDEVGDLQIRVSDMGNWKYEALVGFHELAEVLLCKDRGITTEVVDAFDMTWISKRAGDEEPGDDPDCPYRNEHFFASSVERLLGGQLNVEWGA